MNRLLSAELLKFRTTRSPAVAVLLTAAFAALVPILANADPEGFGVAPLSSASMADFVRAPGQVAAGAPLLVGILGAAAEYSHRTVVTTRLAEPDPRRVLAAKVGAAAVVGALTGAVACLVAGTVGSVGLWLNQVPLRPREFDALPAVVAVVLACTMSAVLGTLLGGLVRQTAAAVGGALLWVFAVEQVIPMLLRSEGISWLPGAALDAVLLPGSGELSAAAGAVLLVAYAAGLFAIVMIADARRDP